MGGEDEAAALVPAVQVRLDAGISPSDIARWLYTDGASGRPIVAIKAMHGAGFALAEAKQLVDDVIAEVDPDYFDRTVIALREEAAATSQPESATTSGSPLRRLFSFLPRLRAGRSGAGG